MLAMEKHVITTKGVQYEIISSYSGAVNRFTVEPEEVMHFLAAGGKLQLQQYQLLQPYEVKRRRPTYGESREEGGQKLARGIRSSFSGRFIWQQYQPHRRAEQRRKSCGDQGSGDGMAKTKKNAYPFRMTATAWSRLWPTGLSTTTMRRRRLPTAESRPEERA